jgi:hypothetical protein
LFVFRLKNGRLRKKTEAKLFAQAAIDFSRAVSVGFLFPLKTVVRCHQPKLSALVASISVKERKRVENWNKLIFNSECLGI